MAHSIWITLLFAMLSAIVAADQYGMLDLNPRVMFEPVAKRQSGSKCLVYGSHTCLEANSTSGLDFCCTNIEYCYLSPNSTVNCCIIGSDCENQCPASSAIAIQQTLTVNKTTTSTFSCSSRACDATSAFLCPASLGGHCCSFSSTCGPDGGCTTTINPATVFPLPSTATCLTGQFSCPTAEGGGCCSIGAKCTASDSTLLCVATATTGPGTLPPPAIRTGLTGITDSNFTEVGTGTSNGLSSGAKAGIGVGVALGVILFAAGIILFAMSRRRAHQNRAQSNRARSDNSNGEKRSTPRSKNNGTDYFGPMAKAGPFTETVTALGSAPLESPDSTNRGVPLSPQEPGDITAPVEKDGSGHVITQNIYVSETPEKPELRIEMP